tara:strand:+ start:14 stop:202 length:189 start_codon:yes stop_codon:yes gene_type:complete
MHLENFVYNNKDTYINNFYRWYHANSVEREIYKEAKLPQDEAETIFRKMWGYKQFENEVFIN